MSVEIVYVILFFFLVYGMATLWSGGSYKED